MSSNKHIQFSGGIFNSAGLRLAITIIMISALSTAYSQPAETPLPPPAPPQEITASIFYRDVEPKLLFQMLSETYHVQFEGVEALNEPISLISEGKEEVNVDGMLQLLNAKLVTENKAAVREGSVIRIVPLEDTHPKTINLTYADPEKVVNTLKALYLAKGDEKGEDKGRKATYIGVHPQLKGVLVVGPKEALTNIETFVKTELDVATPPQPPQAPLQQKYIVLEYLAADEFKQLLEKDIDPGQKFNAAVAPNNTLIISSREPAVFARADELKKTFDIDRMEIRYVPLRNANA
ncbi:MAG: hypothetical protein JW709_11745, partial [Sedimentisphaerales bacterium]|nr:hypothetical protein [Sedimentisphaerales bacterium]